MAKYELTEEQVQFIRDTIFLVEDTNRDTVDDPDIVGELHDEAVANLTIIEQLRNILK